MAGIAWPVDAVPATTGDPVYAARLARQASIAPLAGGATAARPLGARSGIRPGTPATTVVVTATTWTVHQVAGILDVQVPTEAGPYGFAFDEDQTGAMDAAHATWARWDALYVVLDDPAEDDSTSPSCRIEYRAGTAAASPALPATPPDRSMRLCKIVVPQAGGGSPSVVWDPPYLPHATWLVHSDADRDALATALVPTDDYPLDVLHIGAGNTKKGLLERSFNGTAWSAAGGPPVIATVPTAGGYQAFSVNDPLPRVYTSDGLVHVIGGLVSYNTTAPLSGGTAYAINTGSPLPAAQRPAKTVVRPGQIVYATGVPQSAEWRVSTAGIITYTPAASATFTTGTSYATMPDMTWPVA